MLGKRMFSKFFREMSALSWTLGGTGLVLITLSGDTKTLGIYISAVALVVHLVGALSSKEDK
jgi:hypothetical protein